MAYGPDFTYGITEETEEDTVHKRPVLVRRKLKETCCWFNQKVHVTFGSLAFQLVRSALGYLHSQQSSLELGPKVYYRIFHRFLNRTVLLASLITTKGFLPPLILEKVDVSSSRNIPISQPSPSILTLLTKHYIGTMASELPRTMKAWQFTSTSPTIEKNLKLNTSAPLPTHSTSLAADQILVQVLVAALNPVDYKLPEIPLLGGLITGSPATPSIDFAGRVVATGPNSKKVSSTDLKPGQLVFGRLDGPTKFGTLAEYTVAPRAGCVPIPSGVGVIDAACAGTTALTAYQSIIPNIRGGAGERVFINGGSGGCGTFGIQIAKASGCHVTTSCSGPNIELCESLGADTVIDYRSKDIVAELKKMPQFDLVVDNVGLPANLYWAAPSFLKPGAPYVQPGASGINLAFIWEVVCKQMWPRWLGGGQRSWEFLQLVSKVEDYAQIGRWMQEGKVRAVLDEVFDMENKGPVRAFEKLRTGRTRGKIVVKVAERWEE